MSALELELKTYNERLAEMLPHVGKYVLIHGAEIDGFYDTYADALKDAYKKYEPGQFMVKRVAPAEQISYFTRDLVIECRA